jgi:hypothetical protein
LEKLDLALKAIGNRASVHSLFLNTLSLLEYIGCRKILKSQQEDSVSEELLSHALEEIHHAKLLKTLALKLSEGLLTSYQTQHLLCGHEGRAYFQTVDYAVEAAFEKKDKRMNYLLTTFLIEERALKVYPIYSEYLTSLGYSNRLKSLVKDEHRHFKTVSEELNNSRKDYKSVIAPLAEIETIAFNRFLDSVVLEALK